MKARRDQGLCFNCDEQYKAGHKCTSQRLYLLRTEDEDGPENGEDAEEELEVSREQLEISLHALSGVVASHSLKVIGYVAGKRVSVLIDSDSPHNFISNRAIRKLQIQVQPSTAFAVLVANGDKLECKGSCKAVAVEIQGNMFQVYLYPVQLSGIDIVLGVQWLRQLGTVQCNWSDLTMDFEMEGKKYHLLGIKSLDEHPAAFHQLMKLSVEGNKLYVLRQTGKEQELESQADSREFQEALAELLESYDAIFKEPTGLPPKRALDHQIVLKPGIPI